MRHLSDLSLSFEFWWIQLLISFKLSVCPSPEILNARTFGFIPVILVCGFNHNHLFLIKFVEIY